MNLTHSLRKLISYSLVLCIFNLSFLPFGTTRSHPNWLSDKLIESALEYAEQAEQWNENQKSHLFAVLEAAEQFEKWADKKIHHTGPSYVENLILSSAFTYDVPNDYGKATYVNIGGVNTVRVWVKETDEYYLLINKNEIPIDPKAREAYDLHLKQYTTRVHIEAGKDRDLYDENGEVLTTIWGNKKRKLGRNLNIVTIDGGNKLEVEHSPRPKFGTKKWLSEYWDSVKKKPTKSDVSQAIGVGGVMQGTLVGLFSFLQSMVLGVPFDATPAVYTAAFGTFIGTFYSTYKNMTVLSGTALNRILMMTGVSLAYSFGLMVTLTTGETTSTINILSVEGAMVGLSLVGIALANNAAKEPWNGIIRIRDKARLNTESIKKSLFGKELISWNRGNFESQMLYLIPWSINVSSLFLFAQTDLFKVPGTELAFPVLQFAGIIPAMYWAKVSSSRIYQKGLKAKDLQIEIDEVNKAIKFYSSEIDRIHNEGRALEEAETINFLREVRSEFEKKSAELSKIKDLKLAEKVEELEQMKLKYEDAWRSTFGMNIKEIPKKTINLCKNLLNGTRAVIDRAAKRIK